MKFKIYGFQNELLLENGVNLISILNLKLYSKTVFEICNENKEHHSFDLISENYQMEDFYKITNIISNPFVCNFNDKKIITAMHKEFNSLIVEDENLHCSLLRKINEIYEMISRVNYDLEYEIEICEDMIDLLKYFNLKILVKSDNLLDNIFYYINVYSHFFSKTILIFFCLSEMLTDEELFEVSKYANYHNLVIISFEKKNITKNNLNKLIIDNDFFDFVAKDQEKC